MAGMPDPTIANAASAIKNRKQQIDDAVDKAVGKPETKAAPAPAPKGAVPPEPGFFKKLKSLVTGSNPYVEE